MMQVQEPIAAMFDAQSAQLTVANGAHFSVPREVYSEMPSSAIPEAVQHWAVKNHYLEAGQSVGVIPAVA